MALQECQVCTHSLGHRPKQGFHLLLEPIILWVNLEGAARTTEPRANSVTPCPRRCLKEWRQEIQNPSLIKERKQMRETKSKPVQRGKRQSQSVESFKRVKSHQRSHIDKAAEEMDRLLSSFSLPVLIPQHCGTYSRTNFHRELNCSLLAPLVYRRGATWGSDLQPELTPCLFSLPRPSLLLCIRAASLISANSLAFSKHRTLGTRQQFIEEHAREQELANIFCKGTDGK